MSEVGSRQSAVGSRQSAVGSRQSAVGSRQSAVGSRQFLNTLSFRAAKNFTPRFPFIFFYPHALVLDKTHSQSRGACGHVAVRIVGRGGLFMLSDKLVITNYTLFELTCCINCLLQKMFLNKIIGTDIRYLQLLERLANIKTVNETARQ
jgi:hypothetical protein